MCLSDRPGAPHLARGFQKWLVETFMKLAPGLDWYSLDSLVDAPPMAISGPLVTTLKQPSWSSRSCFHQASTSLLDSSLTARQSEANVRWSHGDDHRSAPPRIKDCRLKWLLQPPSLASSSADSDWLHKSWMHIYDIWNTS